MTKMKTLKKGQKATYSREVRGYWEGNYKCEVLEINPITKSGKVRAGYVKIRVDSYRFSRNVITVKYNSLRAA